ncbi:protein translocase subunit SecF [Patescibacteria group bacterium]|nr:protein translocase subunit SecF [Patescibacteria group bacterium]
MFMGIVKNRKIWYAISGLFVAASIFSIFYFGLRLGIDFTGGSLLEVEYINTRPDISVLQEKTKSLDLGNVVLQPTGDNGLIARSKDLTEDEHQQLLSVLVSEGELNEVRFDSIGPVIGEELRQKSWIAIVLVVIMIILYIAFAFRKVSGGLPRGDRGVSSFKFGLMAVVALIHDVSIPFGVFVVLGKFLGVEIDVLFITALLTILGFSVHDTIVVFDRVRENLRKGIGNDFEETVGISVNQTITRSINTSITVLIVLFAIFFFGGETTKWFSLALAIGVAIGTYSSIFLASPLLVTMYKFQEKRSKNKKK